MNDWFKERGIGQEQVAATLNVSVSTVSRIVNYKRDLSMRRAMILHTEFGAGGLRPGLCGLLVRP